VTYAPLDRVQVYDGDEDAWFAGWVESETVLTFPGGRQSCWVVRLDDGPTQFGQKVSVMAVPFSRTEWIKPETSGAAGD
jgi:hypothetical protein